MSGLPDANAVLCALLIVILPLAPAGLAFVNTGLGRSRSAAQALLGALCLMSVAAISYCAVGSSIDTVLSAVGALLAGMVAGGALPLAIEFLEQHCGLDDPSGGIAVHDLAGLWGLLIASVLAQGPPGQLVAQLVGIATLLGLIFPLSYGSCWLINRVIAFRTDREGERLSMDPHELGAGAYPEFVLHSDEFVPR